jgi:predicted Zn-dependent peptidase
MKTKIFRRVLKNGMAVVYEKRDSTVFSVAYAVRYGGINEEAEEKGIAHFIEHMLYKGNEKMGAKEISEAFERRGGIMNGFTDEQITAFWVKAPKKHFFEIFKVLTEMVKNPGFDSNEMNKERKVIFEEIKMINDDPKSFVLDKVHSALYKPPFGLGIAGQKGSLLSIDRDKMTEKFKGIYQPQNMICGIVGNVDFDKVCKFIERSFEKNNGKTEAPKIALNKKSLILKRKGIGQANLVLAFHTPKAKDKKHYAAKVLACLMGGGLSSRLFIEIREKRNLAYGVKAECVADKDYGFTLVYVGTTKDKVKEVKKIILDEFEKVSKELDEKELSSIKEQLIGHFEVLREDSEKVLAFLLYSEVAGNIADIEKFEENIRAVKLDDVKKLARDVKKNYSFLALLPE